MILTIKSLRNDGVPDELANRMSMAHGSRNLLRAMRGEPERPVKPHIRPQAPRPHSSRPAKPAPVAIPKVVRSILDAVAEAFEVVPDDLCSTRKTNELVLARAVAIRLIRDRQWDTGEPKHSFPTIGRYLRRDHSSICHAIQRFDDYAKHFPEVEEVYQRLRTREW